MAKFNVGDVVRLSQKAIQQQWHDKWQELNGDDSFWIVSGPAIGGEYFPLPTPEPIWPIRRVDGSALRVDGSWYSHVGLSFSGYVSECYLERDEFLTAVYRSKKDTL